jgi:hypothetical protein
MSINNKIISKDTDSSCYINPLIQREMRELYAAMKTKIHVTKTDTLIFSHVEIIECEHGAANRIVRVHHIDDNDKYRGYYTYNLCLTCLFKKENNYRNHTVFG